MIVCILGPPRSGTSLTTRILNLLGVELGSRMSLEIKDMHNPKGYFEQRRILAITEKFLAHFGYGYEHIGADWGGPPELPTGWQAAPELIDLRNEALDYVHSEFGGHELWGWKDPRTVFALPFWQWVLPSMRYVVCIRNPVDTARSIKRFVRCSFERGLNLWAMYLLSAMRYTDTHQRLIVDVGAWARDWRPELERLAAFIGRPECADNAQVLAAVAETIDPDLWHHQTGAETLAGMLELYRRIGAGEVGGSGYIHQVCDDLLRKSSAEAAQSDSEVREEEQRKLQQTLYDITSNTEPESRIVLVDGNCLGVDTLPDRVVIPCMERDGAYYGCPDNGELADQEIDRLYNRGADYVAIAWTPFWWLDFYEELNEHLRRSFPCVFQSERLVLFDLRFRVVAERLPS